jgi:hypothetical protein
MATICLNVGGYGSAGEQPERSGPTVDRAESGGDYSLLFSVCPIDGLKSEKLIFLLYKNPGFGKEVIKSILWHKRGEPVRFIPAALVFQFKGSIFQLFFTNSI